MGIAGAPACLCRHMQSPQDLLGSSCSTQQEVAGSCSGAGRLLQDKLIYVAGACGCPAGVCRHACLLAYKRGPPVAFPNPLHNEPGSCAPASVQIQRAVAEGGGPR
jgi:hypothetical protein